MIACIDLNVAVTIDCRGHEEVGGWQVGGCGLNGAVQVIMRCLVDHWSNVAADEHANRMDLNAVCAGQLLWEY